MHQLIAQYACGNVVAVIVVVFGFVGVDAAGEGAEEGYESYIG